MKKYIYYVIILAAFLTSCSEDETTSKSQLLVSEAAEICGEWLAPSSSGSYYTYLELQKNYKVRYFVAQNVVGAKSVTDEDAGSWSLYPDRQEILISVLRHQIPVQALVAFDNNSMSLRNTEYNTIDKFYRIVESIELEAGQTAEISYLKNAVGAECSSLNPDVATVSSDGMVNGIQEGVTFISIKIGEVIAFVKASVNGRVDRFAEETHLMKDDIMAKYGNPSGIFRVDNTFADMYYLNPSSDSCLLEHRYRFNLITGQIKYIFTFYADFPTFLADWDYLENSYFCQDDMSDPVYTLKEKYFDNEYSVRVIIQNTAPNYQIIYTNFDYDF